MNKRGRARVLSLVLAVLMLFAAVPAFAPGGMKAVAAQTPNYPTDIQITFYNTSYNCSGTPLLFQGYPYWVLMDIQYVDDSGQNTTTDSNVIASIEYYYNGQWYKVYETPAPGFTVENGTSEILIDSQHSPGFISASEFEAIFGTNDTTRIPQGVTQIRVNLMDPVYGVDATHYFDVEFPFSVTYTIQSSPSANFQAYYWNGTAWTDDQAFVGMPFDVHVAVKYYECLLGSGFSSYPDPSNLSVTLVNGSAVTWYHPNGQSNPVELTLDSYNLTTGEYNFSVIGLSTNTPIYQEVLEKIVVNDSQNNLINDQETFHIWPLVMEITNVTTQPGVLYQNVPFNVTLTGQVFANISGTLHNFTIAGATQFEGRNPWIIDSDGNNHTMTFGFGAGLIPNGGIGTSHWDYVNFTGSYFNANWKDNMLFINPNPWYSGCNHGLPAQPDTHQPMGHSDKHEHKLYRWTCLH